MGISINVSGVWKTSALPAINVSGVWKSPDSVDINVAGVWKNAHSGLAVDIKADGRYNTRLNAICYSGERFYTTGVEYEVTSTNGSFSKGNWLTSGRKGPPLSSNCSCKFSVSTSRCSVVEKSLAGSEPSESDIVFSLLLLLPAS